MAAPEKEENIWNFWWKACGRDLAAGRYVSGGFCSLIWQIKKEYEPSLLLPMGFGAILVNLPFSGVLDQTLQGGIQSKGIIEWLFQVGIDASEALPILLFIGIGAMIDFGPLLTNL